MELKAFVDKNLERMKTNAIKRKVWLMRKLRLQRWDYFVTFTYSDEFLDEETFRKKLTNTLNTLSQGKVGNMWACWNVAAIPIDFIFTAFSIFPTEMIDNLEEVKDYDARNHCMQTTLQNTHFLKHFGRNDFKPICRPDDVSSVVKYITKYMEKSGERLVYGGKLPTYFQSTFWKKI